MNLVETIRKCFERLHSRASLDTVWSSREALLVRIVAFG
jgi:hypothetical protein